MLPQHDVDRARSAPLVAVLDALDIKPVRRYGREYYYHSPLPGRRDTTPSFCVNEATNQWIDHGTKAAGFGAIDLTLQLIPRASFVEVVEFLLDHVGQALPPTLASTPETDGNAILNFRIEPLTDLGLINYLVVERGLDLSVIRLNQQLVHRYLKQAIYQRVGKNTTYRSVAWQVDNGSWVLKSKGFTAFHGPRSYTHLQVGKTDRLTVFEGFPDYLAALTRAGRPQLEDTDVLVLNSNDNTAQALPLLQGGYKRLNLCLDNDKSGDQTTLIWQQAAEHHGIVARDWRQMWAGYKDVNDCLCRRAITVKKPRKAALKAQREKAAGYGHWWLWVVWRTPRTDKDSGEVFDDMQYNSDDDQPPSKKRLKDIRDDLLAKREIVWYRLCKKKEDGRMWILEEWRENSRSNTK